MNPLQIFLRSLRHACRGLGDVFWAEQSFRLQTGITLVAIALSILFHLEWWEFLLVFLLCGAVMVLEIVNSILERLADAVHPRLSPMVREVKDMMAGAVLLTSLFALITGIIIFYPHFNEVWCAILDSCVRRGEGSA